MQPRTRTQKLIIKCLLWKNSGNPYKMCKLQCITIQSTIVFQTEGLESLGKLQDSPNARSQEYCVHRNSMKFFNVFSAQNLSNLKLECGCCLSLNVQQQCLHYIISCIISQAYFSISSTSTISTSALYLQSVRCEERGIAQSAPLD